MLEQQEKLWDYDAVEPGQAGHPTTVTITPENISRYALAAQNGDPRYRQAGASREYDGALVAMPTMALTYAPLLRDDIAEANGLVALEQSKTARRQTPFAKCEVRWFRPVQAGDTITGARRVLEKYERRGSKFVGGVELTSIPPLVGRWLCQRPIHNLAPTRQACPCRRG